MYYDNIIYFEANLVYFEAVWYILRQSGIFWGHLEYFFRFGMLYQENLATLIEALAAWHMYLASRPSPEQKIPGSNPRP
jgi:hypothetical protein